MMIKKTVARQVRQVFATLVECVRKCPDEAFGLSADGQHDSVGRAAMHVGGSLEGAFPTPEFRERWCCPVASKAECIAYLESCRDDLLLRFVEEQDLATADEQPEYFVSKLDRVLKLLRHAAHHTGEIGCLLRSIGIEEAPFVLL